MGGINLNKVAHLPAVSSGGATGSAPAESGAVPAKHDSNPGGTLASLISVGGMAVGGAAFWAFSGSARKGVAKAPAGTHWMPWIRAEVDGMERISVKRLGNFSLAFSGRLGQGAFQALLGAGVALTVGVAVWSLAAAHDASR